MFSGDDILYNDEQGNRIKGASEKASKGWRFRNINPPGVRVLVSLAQGVLDAVRRGVRAAQRRIEQVRDRRSLTLTKQH